MIKAGLYGEKLWNAIFGGIGGRPIIQAHLAKANSHNWMECPPKRSFNRGGYAPDSENKALAPTVGLKCQKLLCTTLSPGMLCRFDWLHVGPGFIKAHPDDGIQNQPLEKPPPKIFVWRMKTNPKPELFVCRMKPNPKPKMFVWRMKPNPKLKMFVWTMNLNPKPNMFVWKMNLNPKPDMFVWKMNLNPKTQHVCVKNEAQNPDQSEWTATSTSFIGKLSWLS